MEDFRETNFKKIQQLLDKCVAHEYGMKTNALALKREYLTEAQMKDYYTSPKARSRLSGTA